MPTCALCRQDEQGSLNRIAGLDVCDFCYQGELHFRLNLYRQWAGEIREHHVTYKNNTVFYVDIDIVIPQSPPLHLHCKRNSFLRKMFGPIFRGIQVGDPLFDNFVHASSRTKTQTSQWLASDGVQSILIDLLGDVRWITIQQQKISVKQSSSEYKPSQELFREVAVLGHYLEHAAL